jgi:hypothetical protein
MNALFFDESGLIACPIVSNRPLVFYHGVYRYVDLSVAVIIAREASTQDQSSAHPCRQIISRAALKDNLYSDSLALMESLTEEAQVGRLEDSLDALKNSDETIRHTEIGWMSRKTESQSSES